LQAYNIAGFKKFKKIIKLYFANLKIFFEVDMQNGLVLLLQLQEMQFQEYRQAAGPAGWLEKFSEEPDILCNSSTSVENLFNKIGARCWWRSPRQ